MDYTKSFVVDDIREPIIFSEGVDPYELGKRAAALDHDEPLEERQESITRARDILMNVAQDEHHKQWLKGYIAELEKGLDHVTEND